MSNVRHRIKVVEKDTGKPRASSDFIRIEYQIAECDRTCRSVFDTIKEEIEIGKSAGKIYYNMKCSAEGEMAASETPKNLRQVQNVSALLQ
ncbi:hypothetical protein MAR_015757 [Mya arenaria]|uniref:Uncharacterized protein n=1 Tax=Mya arenaria TaxID=6604 RepID=A0ABY7FHY0_MYAAR|nr:hypothetical protein MAR_015757 [Mya arenaria]